MSIYARVSVSLRWVLAGLLSIAAMAANAGAQCNRDGLDGGACCTPATLRLPAFPAITQTAQYACFENCAPRIHHDLEVDIAAPREVNRNGTGVACGIYLIRMTFKTRSTNPQVLWTVRMRGQYARNWLASVGNPGGAPDTEVWRFLINGDMTPSSYLLGRYGQNRCGVPPCVSQYATSHFWGYVDYAQVCATGQWQASFAITHDCDLIEHGTQSARPGTFHPLNSYAFVGPSAGFTFDAASVPAAQGTIVQEDVRRNAWASYPAICTYEERVTQGSVGVSRNLCPCANGGPGTLQYADTGIVGTGECTSRFQSTGSMATPFLQKRIGRWQLGGGVYPGNQYLLLDQGVLTFIDGCFGTTTLELFKGVTTIGGYPAFRLNQTALGRQFIDLGSANRLPSDRSTIVGDKYITNFIINVNLP